MFINKLNGGVKSVLWVLSATMLFGCGGKVVKDQNGTRIEASQSYYPTDDEVAMLQYYCGPKMESNSELLESWFYGVASNEQKTQYRVAKNTFPEKADEMVNNFYYEVASDVESDGAALKQYAILRDIKITGYDKEKSAAQFDIVGYVRSHNKSFPPYLRLKDLDSPYRELIQTFVSYPNRKKFFSRSSDTGISFALADNGLTFYEYSRQEGKTQYIIMSDKQAFDLSTKAEDGSLEAIFIMEPQTCGTYPNPDRRGRDSKINTIEMRVKEVQLYQSGDLVYQISDS